MVDEALAKGWYIALFPIKVGCCSFPATVCYFLQKISVEPKQIKIAIAEIAIAAVWLWLMRDRNWSSNKQCSTLAIPLHLAKTYKVCGQV